MEQFGGEIPETPPWTLVQRKKRTKKKRGSETFRLRPPFEPHVHDNATASLRRVRHCRHTKHSRQRMEEYLGTWSRSGTYIELYPDEHAFLQSKDLTRTILNEGRIVELGFDDDMELVKISVVFEKKNRFLFVCLGMPTGAIKTWYVTPGPKRPLKQINRIVL